MKNKKKTLLMSLAAVLLVAAGVFGTLAYLTSKTGPVTNTFTVGTVDITLDEADVDTDGEPVNGMDQRTDKNKYKLIPGKTYIKDPTVHVTEGSEPSHLYVRVENGLKDQLATETIEEQMEKDEKWKLVEGYTDLWKYKDVVKEDESYKVFETFTLKTDAVMDGLDGKEIKVTAFAIQSEELAEGEDTDKIAAEALGSESE